MTGHAATGPVDLDETDRRIVACLQVDGRRPFSRIAQDLGISDSAVRYRVNRMEEAGILQIVGIADPLRIGFDLMSLIGISIEPGRTDEVVDAITSLPETSYVAVTAGTFDLIVEVICRDTRHFSELLVERVQAVPGVTGTQSFLVHRIHKLAYGWGVGRVASPGDVAAPGDPAD